MGVSARPDSAGDRQPAVDSDALGDALEQRTEMWRTELRDEPTVARLLLRKLVGPFTLWDAADVHVAFDAPVTADRALLDRLTTWWRARHSPVGTTSPAGSSGWTGLRSGVS
jgi:hypothetical protein